MNFWVFVIIFTAIIAGGITVHTTVSAVLRHLSEGRKFQGDSAQRRGGELERTVDDLSGRLARLEEERDFYKDLLESPEKAHQIPPRAMEEDVSDTGGPA